MKENAVPGWTVESWLGSLPLLEILSEALLDESKAEADADDVSCIRGLSDKNIEAAVNLVTLKLKTELKQRRWPSCGRQQRSMPAS